MNKPVVEPSAPCACEGKEKQPKCRVEYLPVDICFMFRGMEVQLSGNP